MVAHILTQAFVTKTWQETKASSITLAKITWSMKNNNKKHPVCVDTCMQIWLRGTDESCTCMTNPEMLNKWILLCDAIVLNYWNRGRQPNNNLNLLQKYKQNYIWYITSVNSVAVVFSYTVHMFFIVRNMSADLLRWGMVRHIIGTWLSWCRRTQMYTVTNKSGIN